MVDLILIFDFALMWGGCEKGRVMPNGDRTLSQPTPLKQATMQRDHSCTGKTALSLVTVSAPRGRRVSALKEMSICTTRKASIKLSFSSCSVFDYVFTGKD